MKETPIEKLLNDLCVDLGFCLPIEIQEQIKVKDFESPDEFARHILEAEGLDSDLEIQFRREIRDLYKEIFGG